jgi:hypothetical protein
MQEIHIKIFIHADITPHDGVYGIFAITTPKRPKTISLIFVMRQFLLFNIKIFFSLQNS